nr:Inhibitor of Bruton tyrosine kinase [Ipomoea batatas]
MDGVHFLYFLLLSSTPKDHFICSIRSSIIDSIFNLEVVSRMGGNRDMSRLTTLCALHYACNHNATPMLKDSLDGEVLPHKRKLKLGFDDLIGELLPRHLLQPSKLMTSTASLGLREIHFYSWLIAKNEAKGSMVLVLFIWTFVLSYGGKLNYTLHTPILHIECIFCKVLGCLFGYSKKIFMVKICSIRIKTLFEVMNSSFGEGRRLRTEMEEIVAGMEQVIMPFWKSLGVGSYLDYTVAADQNNTLILFPTSEFNLWVAVREGSVGESSIDRKLPCKVDSLHGSVVKLVSAAKFHSVAVTSRGEVYTWGFGRGGRLGHPDFDIHRCITVACVKALWARRVKAIAAAKHHTIVATEAGEVFTWGSNRGKGTLVNKVSSLKSRGQLGYVFIAFHRKHVVAIAAGTMHSIVLIDDGALFYWVSADPDLQCRQLYSFCGRDLVSISAGKYWTAAVTVTGDVYMWDGKKDKDKPPSVTRLHGVKKATTVSVGETHLLIISSLYHPVYPSNTMNDPLKLKSRIKCEIDELDEGFMFDDRESNEVLSTVHKEDEKNNCVPSLKSLCEKLAAEYLVEPRSAIQLLEIADSLGADDLRKHCEDIAIRNLDYILTVSGQAFANTSLDILVRLEKLLDLKSSEPWSCRRLPTPTAPFPAITNSEEETSDNESLRMREYSKKRTISKEEGDKRLDNFLQSYDAKEGISKQVRALRKKLQQIEMLEEKQSKGQTLDAQQIAKLQTKSALEHSLSEHGVPIETLQTTTSISVTGKPTKELEASRRQRRKNKQKPSPLEVKPSNCEIIAEPSPEKGCLAADISQANYKEDKHLEGAASPATDQDANESPFCLKKGLSCSPKGTKASPVVNKKKNRKGGLSMFLSGALDDVPKVEVPPPISPKVEGPAWGGAKIAKGSTSLREIQNEQSKIKQTILVKSQDHLEELSDGSNSGRVQLSSYLSSSPVAVASARTTQVSDVERNTPPWATSGTSPLSRPSLRDIQLQQVRHYHGLSQSPKAKIAGFSLMSGQGSPSDSSGMNRWFKPEVEMPSSIRSIQIEERAIKDLKRFYSSVKVVKNQS